MKFDPDTLESFPTQPGVYIMKDAKGEVLYIGKAINLRSRVKQYFAPGGDGRFMVPFLVTKVHTIDTLIVNSEKEALLVENNLIKKHQPRYNALLKDDKTYIALKINYKHTWPMASLVRYRGRPEPDGLYFGPYTSAQAARTTLDILNRLFPLRECSDQELLRRTRPCILYDMKRCVAPCVNKCSKEEYDKYVQSSIKFLKGQDSDIIKELYADMHSASEQLEFEKAGLILKTIQQIEKTIENQSVDKPLGVDADVLGIYRQAEDVIMSQLHIRSGKLMGSHHYNFSKIAQEDTELLESFIIQHYEKMDPLPHEILLPRQLSSANEIAEILGFNKKRKVEIMMPQRGDKKNLLQMAYLNAEATFKKEKNLDEIREKTLLEMQEKLKLNRYPKRIECFDNSNISGTEPVSVMIAFTDGQKDKKRYRKYKVNNVNGIDDYGTFYEVLTRRYKRGKDENELPDLLIIDGGKGHLNVALKVLADLDIITVDVISIAKEASRHDKGMSAEQIFLPNIKDPIILRSTSPLLFLLQQIRDEAHRFAITFHRNRRSKQLIRTSITNIPGIGPQKSQKLLRHFGSLKKIKEASVEELKQVEGINQANVEAILKFLNIQSGDQPTTN